MSSGAETRCSLAEQIVIRAAPGILVAWTPPGVRLTPRIGIEHVGSRMASWALLTEGELAVLSALGVEVAHDIPPSVSFTKVLCHGTGGREG